MKFGVEILLDLFEELLKMIEIMNSFKIKISIITVCRNSEAFLAETINSVISQTYPNIEYIIIDGKSTDATTDIIKQYSSYITYWISEEDKSMYDAINKGLKVATGDYILVLNSDDMLADKLVIKKVADEIEKKKFDYYYGDVIKLKKNEPVPVKLFQVNYHQLLYSTHCSFVHHPCFFISKKLNNQLIEYNLQYRYASDYDYILRALNTPDTKGKHISVYTTIFRFHKNSITASGKIDTERKAILLSHGYYRLPKLKRIINYYILWGYYKLINLM
jgi:glycosyltransferase involved in cell wall biosynthesis